MSSSKRSQRGLTAVEVLVSTLLASLLMVAMLSVLRGLKAQDAAISERMPVESWQRRLDAVLQSDLENSRSYKLTKTILMLNGFTGRDPQTGSSSWKPASVIYKIVPDGNRSWLARRVAERNSSNPELVFSDVTAIRINSQVGQDGQTSSQQEAHIVDGLSIEFWGADTGGPLYGFTYRQL